MKNRYKIILSITSAIFIAGCSGLGIGGSGGALNDSQKQEFLQILENDTYSSLCNLTPMYEQYKATKDDKILSELFVRYTQNLANSCIDIDNFKKALEKRKEQKINAVYEIHEDYVSSSDLFNQLQKGKSVKAILDEYVPPMPQFYKLINAYNVATSPELKHKIKLNIERTKLMDPDPSHWNTYVLINVPEFKFRLFENGQKTMEFNVITGRPTWPTPIFDGTLRYISVNPTWNVPDNIARKEEIPKIIKDPSYLRRHNMVVKRDYAPDSPTVDPKKVNWKEYLKPEWANKELPYKIIEQSSSHNALGRVKFLFPNKYSVYMHDTNNKKLFAHQIRAFSHGCIRLEQPLRFLGHLSTFYTTKKFEEVGEFLKSKKTKVVGLKQKIPVHIVYLTAYVENGVANFFPDVYGYDKMQQLKAPIKLVKKK